MKFIDDKVEQRMTGCQIRARQCQDVALQPTGKRPKVLSELMHPCFEAKQFGKPGDEQAVLTASTGVGEAGFEVFAFRADASGDAGPEYGEGFELLMVVEPVASAPATRPGELRAGAEA